MNKYHADSPLIPVLLAAIEQNPGIGSKPLADLIGRSWPHVKKGLAFMNANKMAGYCELGKLQRGWFLWDEAEKRNAGFMSLKDKSRMRRLQRPPSARSQIEKMAATDEDGASTLKLCELLDAAEKDVNRHCLSLVKRGRLFRASRRGFRLRWFATQEAAQKWEALPDGDGSEFRPKPGRAANPDAPKKPKPEKVQKAPKLVAIGAKIKNKARQPSKAPPLLEGSRKNTPPKGLEAPVTLKGKATDMRGAVDYSKAKITICPSPKFNYRHEYAPGSEAWTGFAKEWQQLRGQP